MTNTAFLPDTEYECPIDGLATSVFRVPTDGPEADGTLAWDSTTVVVVEVRAAGRAGLGWTYATDACKALLDTEMHKEVLASNAFDVVGIHERVVRKCRNLGRPGLVSLALSALDIALWDLKARLLDISLSRLFGRFREAVPVYGSGGFTTYDQRRLADQLEHWTGELGIPRVKIKIGESWGTRAPRDLARVAETRSVVGDEVELYVDANGAYSRKQAVRIGQACAERFGVTWYEEPVSSDDLVGLREVSEQVDADVAAGEYGFDESYFARMVEARAVDCLQIDVTRCGGYTGFLRAAGIAAAHNLDVSGHCAPSLHAPVAAAVPNLRHVEYFHDHERCDGLLFDGALIPRGGEIHPDYGAAGHGMHLKDAEQYRVA